MYFNSLIGEKIEDVDYGRGYILACCLAHFKVLFRCGIRKIWYWDFANPALASFCKKEAEFDFFCHEGNWCYFFDEFICQEPDPEEEALFRQYLLDIGIKP